MARRVLSYGWRNRRAALFVRGPTEYLSIHCRCSSRLKLSASSYSVLGATLAAMRRLLPGGGRCSPTTRVILRFMRRSGYRSCRCSRLSSSRFCHRLSRCSAFSPSSAKSTWSHRSHPRNGRPLLLSGRARGTPTTAGPDLQGRGRS